MALWAGSAGPVSKNAFSNDYRKRAVLHRGTLRGWRPQRPPIASPKSYCIVVTRDDAAIFDLPSEAEIEKAVNAHLKAIANKQDLGESGRVVFKAILPAGATSKANLIVVPDG